MTGRRVTLVATDGSSAQVRAERPESRRPQHLDGSTALLVGLLAGLAAVAALAGLLVDGVLLMRTARRRLGT